MLAKACFLQFKLCVLQGYSLTSFSFSAHASFSSHPPMQIVSGIWFCALADTAAKGNGLTVAVLHFFLPTAGVSDSC